MVQLTSKMDRSPRCLVFLVSFSFSLSLVSTDIYSVKIGTENHVNEVDSKFVSFTIDPKHLFSSSDNTKGKESTCMAASLTPAYIRIAGPSTSHITFNNTSMSIDDFDTNLPEPNKQKRHLGSQKREQQLFDSAENHEDILSELKKSSQKLAAKRQRKQQTFDSKESHEDMLSKLKKNSQRLATKRKRDLEFDSQETENLKTLEDDSHETILSKLKKSKSHGSLLAKFKRSKAGSEEIINSKNRLRRSGHKDNLEVSHRQWKRFIKWAKDTGFDLVFAVNNGEKTENGMWDPNPALNMLTIADKDNVTDIFWQLGYECTNQTIEEYLNDLETLQVMVDTFGSRRWKVVGGDITSCLQEGSKSDFKDYVTLSSEMMGAVLLNGNSSSRELSRMSPSSRQSLLRSLSTSPTPLWLTETPQQLNEMARAADWLTSLGYSAQNGFNVHFRELIKNELYEPTLSFYMALLFKNLVGERVLDLTMDNTESNAALFAHCTSLRHKAVPGAVTLYGVNMDSEPARFSVKLSRREEGGDIMQFILGHDHNGNIVVNGRAMFYEGDIRPVVKRVRPYKTLLLNLPSKTFGFWVLANTKVNACYDNDDNNTTLVKAKPVNNTNYEGKDKLETAEPDSVSDEEKRKKRSLNVDDFAIDFNVIDTDDASNNRFDSMNRGLRDVQGLFGSNEMPFLRAKRQIFDENLESRKESMRQNLKKIKHEHKLLGAGIIEKLRNNIHIPKLNLTKNLKELKLRKSLRLGKNKLSKRNSRNYRNKEDNSQEADDDDFLSRRRRSVFTKQNKKQSEDKTAENEIDTDDKKHTKFGRFLHKQEKFKNFIEKKYESENKSFEEDKDEIEINTKLTDDDAVFKITENADHGLLKSTFENVLSLLEELNNNLSKLWTALSILE